MHWVIQENLYNEAGFQALLTALDRLGVSYSLHKVIPFARVLEPPATPPPGPVMVMGAYTMLEIAQREGWQPLFFNENFDYEVQLQHWGKRMLNHGFTFTTFAEVDPSGWEEPFFIRPVTDSKCFAGCVQWPDQFTDWQSKVLDLGADNGGTLTGSTRVMWGPVRKIYREWRMWVVDGKVVTASLYKEGTRVRSDRMVDRDVLLFASGIAQGCSNIQGRWSPADAYCLDVCETPDGYRIVEVNDIHAAGFYAADMNLLVQALGRVGNR